jgi:hypothetical protein
MALSPGRRLTADWLRALGRAARRALLLRALFRAGLFRAVLFRAALRDALRAPPRLVLLLRATGRVPARRFRAPAERLAFFLPRGGICLLRRAPARSVRGA